MPGKTQNKFTRKQINAELDKAIDRANLTPAGRIALSRAIDTTDMQTTGPLEPSAAAPASGIEATLKARGSKYGSLWANGRFSQQAKEMMREQPNWQKLSYDKQEALDMIAFKISRILTGDPEYADNWHDIAGYATLVEKKLAEDSHCTKN